MTHNGKTQSLSAWEEETGIKAATIKFRIFRAGWSAERSLTTPVARSAAAENE